MGVFGAGLYSGDFAMDLRSAVSAVSRLPYDGERLVETLIATQPAANNPADEDHTTFWLVLADQFAKRGIVSNAVRDKAIEIIDRNHDLSKLEELGMSAIDLRKRKKILGELRGRLLAPVVSKPRVVLKSPQPLIMEIGDVFAYPTCQGHNINPYLKNKELDPVVSRSWVQDGWAAAVIVDRGRAFDFLSWYRPLTVRNSSSHKPTIESLNDETLWILRRPGTCSALHMKKMELEPVGRFPIDSAKLREAFPNLRPGDSYAIQDISLANSLHARLPDYSINAGPQKHSPGAYPTIPDIRQILPD